MKKTSRRRFLQASGWAMASGAVATADDLGRVSPSPLSLSMPKGRAQSCIMIWLGGGMSHLDTFDPKRLGDPTAGVPGSAYPAIETAVSGVRVCQHLRDCAAVMDRMTIVRGVHHDVIDEHAAAVIRVHTGRPTSGTIQYPSIGSIVSHELQEPNAEEPAYVVIGYPNVARDPGFLGAESGYLYVTDTHSGPTGLTRPPGVSAERQARRQAWLGQLRQQAEGREHLAEYDAMLERSLELAGPRFMNVFRLTEEPASTREAYGSEFGQRCLLARRLVERGTRFVEVSHNLNFTNGTGWDTHFEGQQKQHLLIQELDRALATLIRDLEGKGRLDDTLVVVGTEFGRPAKFDARGGRGHYGKAFSLVLAGGGLRHCGAYGVTNEWGLQIEENGVSIPDFHATILAALGIDAGKSLYAGDRPVPVTDGGSPIQSLFG